MDEKIYITTPEGSNIQVSFITAKLIEVRGIDRNDSFEFTAPTESGVIEGCYVRYEINEEVRFKGATLQPARKAGENVTTWKCVPSIALAKHRYTFPIRYGTLPVEGDYSGLAIKYVYSSDPPVQVGDTLDDGSLAIATDPMTHVPGLVWSLNSLVPPKLSILSISSAGVWHYIGLGTASRGGDGDVYFAGHLCADAGGDVYDEAVLTGSNYQFWRDAKHLYAYGTGEGDAYGPVYIHNAFDSHLRVGNLDRADDFILAALDVGTEAYWPLLKDFLETNQMYLHLRGNADYTYIDGMVSQPGRGNRDAGFIELSPDAWVGFDQTKVDTPPTTALITVGMGANYPGGEKYILTDMAKNKLWVEELYNPGDIFRSPVGVLDTLADNRWDEIRGTENIRIKTHLDILKPWDWVTINNPPDGPVTLQVREIQSRAGEQIRTVKFGGLDATVADAFLDITRSAAVKELEAGAIHGTQTGADLLGHTEILNAAWTPAAEADRDTVVVLFSIVASSSDSDYADLRVTYTVTVNGTVVALLRHRPWGGQAITNLNITDGCKLDGTEETLTVSVIDPTGTLAENISYTWTVQGIGRYGQTAIGRLNPSSTIENSWYLNQGSSIHTALSGYGHITKYGTASCRLGMTTYAVPNYRIKIVVNAMCACGNYNEFTHHWSNCGGPQIRLWIRTYDTVYYGEYEALSSGGGGYKRLPYMHMHTKEWRTNPFTGSVWTQVEIDGLETGIDCLASDNCAAICDSLWVELK